jgi:hypothetical protein
MRPAAVNADGRQMGIAARAKCGCVSGLALDVPGDMECVATLKAWKRYTPPAADPVLVRR